MESYRKKKVKQTSKDEEKKKMENQRISQSPPRSLAKHLNDTIPLLGVKKIYP